MIFPNRIKQYNRYMGRVDRIDQNVGSLRISLKGKKWWYPLFLSGVDAAYQKMGEFTMRGLDFPKQDTNIAIIRHNSCVEIIMLGSTSTVGMTATLQLPFFSFQLTYKVCL